MLFGVQKFEVFFFFKGSYDVIFIFSFLFGVLQADCA